MAVMMMAYNNDGAYVPGPITDGFSAGDGMFKSDYMWYWRIEMQTVPEIWYVGVWIDGTEYAVAVKRFDALCRPAGSSVFVKTDFIWTENNVGSVGGDRTFGINVPIACRLNEYAGNASASMAVEIQSVRIGVRWERWALANGWDVFVGFEKIEPTVGTLSAETKKVMDMTKIIDKNGKITTTPMDVVRVAKIYLIDKFGNDVPSGINAVTDVLRVYGCDLGTADFRYKLESNPVALATMASQMCAETDGTTETKSDDPA